MINYPNKLSDNIAFRNAGSVEKLRQHCIPHVLLHTDTEVVLFAKNHLALDTGEIILHQHWSPSASYPRPIDVSPEASPYEFEHAPTIRTSVPAHNDTVSILLEAHPLTFELSDAASGNFTHFVAPNADCAAFTTNHFNT